MSGKMKAPRHRTAAGNRFYIDSGSVLWGYGSNDYGQLGNGQRDELGVFYSEPIRIASDVVSVDMSMNGYFCIYLTSDGKLYGMGADTDHILGADAAAENAPMVMIASETFPVVTEPVLIEEDVVYARAGVQCIVYLKNDGSVWWQGRYEGTYHSGTVEIPSWARGWDAEDPFRMRADSPQKLLDDCIYVTTGNNTGAAITREGETRKLKRVLQAIWTMSRHITIQIHLFRSGSGNIQRLLTASPSVSLSGGCGEKKHAGYWTKHGCNIVLHMLNIQIL